jgi:glutathione S-transferase
VDKVSLVIGNKNYSSWSLRAWLALRKAGVDFEERRLPLDTVQFAEDIGEYSPTAKVPALWDGSLCVWDSLAICEHINDRWMAGELWPAELAQRSKARSISAEMHAGFPALREKMPMNCRASDRFVPMDAELERDINRVLSIWRECREELSGSGPWLFGAFSIADAMYAPVALRLHTYGIEVPAAAHNYIETVMHDRDVSEWMAAARDEVEVVEADEAGV